MLLVIDIQRIQFGKMMAISSEIVDIDSKGACLFIYCIDIKFEMTRMIEIVWKLKEPRVQSNHILKLTIKIKIISNFSNKLYN